MDCKKPESEKAIVSGFLAKTAWNIFLLYGAAAALGAIVLPINWRLSAEEAVFNLNDGEPVFLFVDPEYQEMIEDNKSQAFISEEIF